ncbi:MAG: hypothetical protein ACAH59_02310 [Pseudobdellovibrionaceae bacterium]
MEFLSRLFERILTSLLITFLLFFASFSFLTGQFPPRKADLIKTIRLTRDIIFTSKEINQEQKSLAGRPPNIDQLLKVQRLGLRRTEITVELQNIFQRIPQGVPNPELAEKIQRASNHLTGLESELNSIQATLEKSMESR